MNAGGIKAAVCSLLSSPSLVGFRSELFSYLRNMLFGLARSLARSLHSLWVTLLSGPAHVVSVREERRCNDTSVRQLAAAADFTAEGERRDGEKRRERRRARQGTHAHSLAKVGGGESGPTHSLAHSSSQLPTFLPTFPCPYCPWRSSNHFYVVARRRTVRSPRCPLPPFPLVEASLWKERRCSN